MEFKGKCLLITGGTGSFGNAVLKKILNTNIEEIRIFSRDEKKQDDMRHKINNPKIKFYIGDVRDKDSVDYAMLGVDCIFHAAALKQVPTCEFFPMEAVRTNVIGTGNVIDSAIEHKVKKVVVLSTDKAVYPINAMGLSKAMMEKVMIAKSRTLKEGDTIICGTRYGNVMGSRGSVIPLFYNQVLSNRDITVTNPNMTRFMMTLDEAIELVFHAFKFGGNGDIFVQKAPAVSIGTLAEAIRELMDSNVKIKIIGTRHGEKLSEVLVSREEMARSEDIGKYFKIPCDDRDLNYGMYFEKGQKKVSVMEDYTSNNTIKLDIGQMKKMLFQLDMFNKSNQTAEHEV